MIFINALPNMHNHIYAYMRYLSLSSDDRHLMMQTVGIKSVDEIYQQQGAVVNKNFNIPNQKNEQETLEYMANLAEKNTTFKHIFAGWGRYHHFIPSAVDAIIQRGEFLTSYTPYQPEVSQGTLQVIFEFQSLMCAITEMEVANASLYDGQTSTAEAVLMALRIRKNATKVCIAGQLHPDYLAVLKTYLSNLEIETVFQPIDAISIDETFACVVTQLPDFSGNVHNLENIRNICDTTKTLMIVVNNEILAFGMVNPPKADIICGDASSLGCSLSFGGPSLGYFTCKKEFVRQMPGRVCGITQDEDGKRSFVLTLSAREQHIRRDKATSNICSNQGLCATAFTVHATLLGEAGFKNLALQNHEKACKLADALANYGLKVVNTTFFNEFVFECNNAENVLQKLEENGILGGVLYGENQILACVTEMVSDEIITKYAEIVSKSLS